MPSRHSSKETRAVAEQAAKDLDASFVVLPFDDAYEAELKAVEKMLQLGETISQMASTVNTPISNTPMSVPVRALIWMPK